MNIELKTGTKQQTLKTDKQNLTILEVFQENGSYIRPVAETEPVKNALSL